MAAIGHADQANHQYDLTDFDAAVRADNLPQVSFLKAASFEDSHPGYSDPLDEQHFIARTLDELEQSPDWGSTAVVIAYDDSDGWYDHEHVVSQHSDAPADQAICNTPPPPAADYKDRCGPGPRLPLLVISPWVKVNNVDHTQLEQASIIHFIEDNWLGGARIGDQSFDAGAASLASMFDFNPADARAPKVYLDSGLRLKKKAIARSGAHRVASGRVKLVLKAKHAIRNGRYTLRVRVTQVWQARP